MTHDNLILVKGGSYIAVKKALKQWVELYSKNLIEGLEFRVYKNGRSNHIIVADERLNNEYFFFLVNYIKYPEGIDYKIDIEGFTFGKEEGKLNQKELLVYISTTDTEYDNVFVVTSKNEQYKIDFGGKIIEVDGGPKFKLPADLELANPDLITVARKKSSKLKEKSDKSLGERFKIISLIGFGLLIVSYALTFYDLEWFTELNFFVGAGFGVWFFFDYEILQSNKYYTLSLLISIVFLGYSIYMKEELSMDIKLVDLGAFYPITLLIIQKPLRFIFKLLLKREPIIDKPPPSFWDGVYMLTLFLSFGILPFIITDYIN